MLAKHEFGIMQNTPKPKKRYDRYEPKKYNCISVDDYYIENIAPLLTHVDFYWHTLDTPAKGMAYTGITLIPPTSMQPFITMIQDINELNELKDLLEKARSENKWVIHFGL